MFSLSFASQIKSFVCSVENKALITSFLEHAKDFYSYYGWNIILIALIICLFTSIVKPFYKKIIMSMSDRASVELSYYKGYTGQLLDTEVECLTEEQLGNYSKEFAIANAKLKKLTLRASANWYKDSVSFVSFLVVLFFTIILTCIYFAVKTGEFSFLVNSGYYTYCLGVTALCKLIYYMYEKVGLQGLMVSIIKAVFNIDLTSTDKKK